jgi:hypothetical protein
VHIVSVEPDPILYAPDDFEGPPADFDTPKELFWGDNPPSWLGVEGDKWDLEEVAKAAITPAIEETICSKLSAQLEGEKTERLTIGNEQPATLDTLTTSRLATPAGLTLMHSMAPRHKSLPASAPLQPQRSAHMWNSPCTEHNLQADKGITPMHSLQPLAPPAKDAEEAGGVCPTTISMPEPPGDTEEAGGVPATTVETPEPVKAVAGLGNLTLSDGVWADPQRRLSV